jgi:Ca-activated chloride channel family protein
MPEFTNNIAALRAAVPEEIPDNAPTPLWKAVDQALASFGDARGRRVVLVLSDGRNQQVGFGKIWNVLEVIDRAQREDVMIYAIGLHSRSRGVAPGGGIGGGLGGFGGNRQGLLDDQPDPELPRAAAETGGGYFAIKASDDLGAAFARVADELHRQYVLGFVPPAADGKLHRLEVKVKKDDMRPRARKNYLAPKKPAAALVPLR